MAHWFTYLEVGPEVSVEEVAEDAQSLLEVDRLLWVMAGAHHQEGSVHDVVLGLCQSRAAVVDVVPQCGHRDLKEKKRNTSVNV